MDPCLRFTIVIPARNEAANLSSVVEEMVSLLAGERFEIVIVDDGSSDGTPAFAMPSTRGAAEKAPPS